MVRVLQQAYNIYLYIVKNPVSVPMKVCKACGVPNIVGRDHEWNPDGTITLSGDRDFRMAFFEVPVIRSIVSKLEKLVGPSIHNMAMEGSRKYAREYTNNLLKGPLRFIVRRTRTGALKAYNKLLDTAVALGYGKVEIGEYEHGRFVNGLVHNPYYIPHFVGIVRGSFEAIEGAFSTSTWEDRGDTAHIEVRRLEGEIPLEERFVFDDPPRVATDVGHDHCERCGLPTDVARLKWDREKGTIKDERTGIRIIMMGLRDLNSVFRELEDAIGEVVPRTIREATREWGREQVKKGWVTDLDDLRRDLAIKGLGGLAVVDKDRDGRRRLIVHNPYNKDYLVGTCLGVIDGLEGRMDVRADIAERAGIVELIVQG